MSHNTIKFKDEHVTVLMLARKLGKSLQEMTKDLTENEEIPYGDKVSPDYILGFNLVEKACRRAGFKAIDEREPNHSTTLTKDEWKVYRATAEKGVLFHKNLAVTILEVEGKDEPLSLAKAEFHNGQAEIIGKIIKHLDLEFNPKKTQESPTI